MKTFETEKGNIPEGATHYSDEQEGSYFCWYIVSGDLAEICVLDGVGFGLKWHRCTNEHKGINVKPIPQTKEVEWVNGDIANTPDGEGCLVAEVYRDGYSYWIVQFKDNFHPFDLSELSKPETEAERKEREEIEAASYLLSDWFNAIGKDMPEWSGVNEDVKAHYLRIVRKTNYKVKGE